MITPILIPMRSSEPDRCPNCNKEEYTKTLCKHCNYEYEEEDEPTWTKVALIVLPSFWALATIIFWFVDQGKYGDKRTLVEIIISQFEFVADLILHKIF